MAGMLPTASMAMIRIQQNMRCMLAMMQNTLEKHKHVGRDILPTEAN